jgi:glycine C-acetyltransferase
MQVLLMVFVCVKHNVIVMSITICLILNEMQESSHLRSRIIVTDGSFSMDGTIAQLDKICDLADKYDAIVMIDECHSSGFLGKTGRGTHEYRGVMGRIDIITGTLGKAIGWGKWWFYQWQKRDH